MSKRKLRVLRLLAVFFVLIISGGVYAYKNRTRYHWYHLVSIKLRGDVALDRTLKKYNVQFVPYDHKVYVQPTEKTTRFALKWRVRPSHAVPTYPVPPVDDTDGDGVPEVYLGSYTRDVRALDGRTGETLWTWKLPFGVVGGRSLILAQLNQRPTKSLLVGTHTTLPIRVYALDVDKAASEAKRLLWARNLSGDFLEGGLNAVELEGHGSLIVAATRDAPYSRGSLNVLDAQGRPVIRPISGLDVCINRPAIGDVNGDGRLDLVHGSHEFYQSQFGYMVAARELESGRLLWAKKMDFDTGNRNHAIIDLDGDGNPEVIANDVQKAVVLDGRTGEKKREIPMEYLGAVQNRSSELLILMKAQRHLVVRRSDGTVVYRLKRPVDRIPIDIDAFGVRLAGDAHYSLMTFSNEGQSLRLTVYDIETGRKKAQYFLPFDPPPADLSTRALLGSPQDSPSQEWGGFVSLADLDGDGFWEVLFQAEDYTYAIDTPFQIAKDYHPYSPNPFRNIDNNGFIFHPQKQKRPRG